MRLFLCISPPFTDSATLYNRYLFFLLSLKLFLCWLTNRNKNKQSSLSTPTIQFNSHLLITTNLLERVNYTVPHIYFLAVCFFPFHSTESFLYTKWLLYWHTQLILSSHITWSLRSICQCWPFYAWNFLPFVSVVPFSWYLFFSFFFPIS